VGCQLGQIVKSLVFKGKRSERPILVIASGTNRVNERAIEVLIGEPLGKADADFVRQRTGFSIGGVPPVGHTEPLLTFVDQDLLAFDEIWAAAGTPNAVFRLTPQDLARMTGGQVIKIT
jgi:prolyl-tRNA editing enzyme YbaK/EbsC (Cys-tRNA(Pro) deacylase)